MRIGDKVVIQCDGRTITGTILLASSNGKSLALGFDAILDGHVGMMPVLRDDDGTYHSIVTGISVQLRKLDH